MGIEVPTQYGGTGGDFFSSVLAIQELARVDLAVSTLVDAQNTLIINSFRNWASQAQKEQWFPRLATDTVGVGIVKKCDVNETVHLHKYRPELQQLRLTALLWLQVGSFGLSEASSGSDAFAMSTKAVQDGDHYVINGTKMWITNSEHAGVFLVMANASPEQVTSTRVRQSVLVQAHVVLVQARVALIQVRVVPRPPEKSLL